MPKYKKGHWTNKKKNMKNGKYDGAAELALRVKVLVVKGNELSSVFMTHTIKGEHWPLYMCTMAEMSSHTGAQVSK